MQAITTDIAHSVVCVCVYFHVFSAWENYAKTGLLVASLGYGLM